MNARTTATSPTRRAASRITILGLLLSGPLGCASTPAPPPPEVATEAPAPIFLWKVTDQRGAPGQLYLLGSAHLQDPEEATLDDAIHSALKTADEVVVEVDTNKIDPAEMQQITLARGFLPEGESIQGKVSPETNALLEQRCQELGLQPEIFTRMRPWLASVTITVLKLKIDGYDEQVGVDNLVLGNAERTSKPVRELESFEEQIGLFSDLDPALEEALLLDALYDTEAGKEQTADIFDAYRSGDTERAEEVFFGDLKEHPELGPLYDRLFTDRNRKMAAKLEEMIKEQKTFFVTVGVGHMVGDDGLVAMMERAGYTVERVAPQGRGEVRG